MWTKYDEIYYNKQTNKQSKWTRMKVFCWSNKRFLFIKFRQLEITDVIGKQFFLLTYHACVYIRFSCANAMLMLWLCIVVSWYWPDDACMNMGLFHITLHTIYSDSVVDAEGRTACSFLLRNHHIHRFVRYENQRLSYRIFEMLNIEIKKKKQ